MGTVGDSKRVSGDNLKSQLFKGVYDFDFHQVVRLMESFTPGCMPLGEGRTSEGEALRICSRISFSFATGDLNTLSLPNPGLPMATKPELSINFMGLAGNSKPIPTPYAYRFYQQIRWKDTATRDFLDIFNHRFVSILYRIHKKFRVELSSVPLESTIFGKALSSFSGVYQGSDFLRNRLGVSDRSILGYAGYFWTNPHSCYGLKKILATYFTIPIVSKQFLGGWIKASDSEWTCLSAIKKSFNRLGETTILGSRTWDQCSGISLKVGPISYKRFLTFLPSIGDKYTSFCSLARIYIGDFYNLKVDFTIDKNTIPKVKLGKKSYLGYTTWMHVKPLKNNDDQVSITCEFLE